MVLPHRSGRSGNGFQLDDEKLAYPFYQKSRELGLRRFSVHKGYASQSRTLGHLAHPADIEKAAKDNPDITFIIYHSAMKHGPDEPGFKTTFHPDTGDFAWHAELMKIKERNPGMSNVFPEIGSAFGTTVIVNPLMCQHLIGKNIKYDGADHVIWGTDCLWWGSPQWVIDAFKRFQISDELCDKFGYKKVTKEDKAKIFGLNAAKIYGVDVNEKRHALPSDTLSQLKVSYLQEGGNPTTPLTAGFARTCDIHVEASPIDSPPARIGRRRGFCRDRRRRSGCWSAVGRSGLCARAEGANWGSDHVASPLPEFATGDECLFCHRDRFGTDWSKNFHQRTMRPFEAEAVSAAALKANPQTGRFADQVEFLLGERRQVRFLKRSAEYGKLVMLSAAFSPPPRGTNSRRAHGKLIDLKDVALGRADVCQTMCRLPHDGGRPENPSFFVDFARLLHLSRRGRSKTCRHEKGLHEQSPARSATCDCRHLRSVPSSQRQVTGDGPPLSNQFRRRRQPVPRLPSGTDRRRSRDDESGRSSCRPERT